ncbi:hypothetical protein NFI96_015458 [Prochilodus magdalenae]|nr:hypothetical protein NFI96_015458 [Prochilodus magdalenae]
MSKITYFYRFVFRMASSFVPAENPKNGLTIVTHVGAEVMEQYSLGTGGGVPTQGPLKTLLKGEPKALGTVQIMIGSLTFLLGVIKTVYFPLLQTISISYWSSCLYITSGSLSVAAAKKANRCVVTSSLIMHVISAVAAGIALIILSIEMAMDLDYYRSCSHRFSDSDNYFCESSIWRNVFLGQSVVINGGLLVFAVLEFIISICTSGFACRATCCTGPVAMIYLNYPDTWNLVENV